MTKREAAVVMAYTGVCMLEGEDMNLFYEYLAKLFGRPAYTHELLKLEPEIKKRARKDFLNICRNLRDEEDRDG